MPDEEHYSTNNSCRSTLRCRLKPLLRRHIPGGLVVVGTYVTHASVSLQRLRTQPPKSLLELPRRARVSERRERTPELCACRIPHPRRSSGHGFAIPMTRRRLIRRGLDKDSGIMAGCAFTSDLSRRHQRFRRVAVEPHRDCAMLLRLTARSATSMTWLSKPLPWPDPGAVHNPQVPRPGFDPAGVVGPVLSVDGRCYKPALSQLTGAFGALG